MATLSLFHQFLVQFVISYKYDLSARITGILKHWCW